jgi:hypothetical protein
MSKLEEGTDVSEINAPSENTKVEVEYKNKIWKFEFESLDWEKRTDLAMECSSEGSAFGGFDPIKFLDKLCVRHLRKSPAGFDYRKMTPDFGDKFITAVSKKISTNIEDISEEEIKN